MLERVEPSRLKQLGMMLAFGETPTDAELVDWVSQELPFCEAEEDGACIGIDGAFYLAVDLLNDITILSLLKDGDWIRNRGEGRAVRFEVTDAADELSLSDARVLLALLAVATYNDGEFPMPEALTSGSFEHVLRMVECEPRRLSMRPSQLPRLRRPSERPSIPPGVSATFDSMRPSRNSVRPSEMPESPESPQLAAALVEWVLTLPRHTVISAAFALAERGADGNVIVVGPTGGRAILAVDALEQAEQLFDDHQDSMPPISQENATLAYRKRLASSLTFFGVGQSDAASLVNLALERGCFPDAWSRSSPPPRALVRHELRAAPEELLEPAAKLVYDVFFCEEYPSVSAMLTELLAR